MTPPGPPARHRTGTGQLLVDVAGAVAVVTINNPGKRNALSGEIRAALPGAAGRAAGRRRRPRRGPHRRRGQGALPPEPTSPSSAEQRTSGRRARRIRPCPGGDLRRPGLSLEKPVIAMIRGYCLGQGLLTAVRADIRIASDDSQFGIPAARLGLGPRFTSVAAPDGPGRAGAASEILFSARRFPAAEALQMGLVNRVVPAADLRDEVMGLARDIARTRRSPSPRARRRSARRRGPRPARSGPGRGDDRGLLPVRRLHAEGQRAFAEKRPPAFTGR